MSILILSKEAELSTEKVMDWIHYLGGKAVRINHDNLGDKDLVEFSLTKNNKIQEILEDITTVWNRKWFRGNVSQDFQPSSLPPAIASALLKYIDREHQTITDYIFLSATQKKMVDKINVSLPFNKIQVLKMALDCGLKIPETAILSTRTALHRFLKENSRVITKPLGEIEFFEDAGIHFPMFTQEVKEQDILDYPNETFSPSLFQQLIEKRYELRIFYLEGKFYPMAIFSQRRNEAKIDFRNYDFENPDRFVPFKLDDMTTTNLLKLVRSLNLSHCSIDCMVGLDGDIYFLEINPVGQFAMVSYPCNYNLELKIAEHLTHKENEF